ncbi:MAG: hypothetical protein ACTSW1_07340 [Candidatus Hodarchaeales archaeon]
MVQKGAEQLEQVIAKVRRVAGSTTETLQRQGTKVVSEIERRIPQILKEGREDVEEIAEAIKARIDEARKAPPPPTEKVEPGVPVVKRTILKEFPTPDLGTGITKFQEKEYERLVEEEREKFLLESKRVEEEAIRKLETEVKGTVLPLEKDIEELKKQFVPTKQIELTDSEGKISRIQLKEADKFIEELKQESIRKGQEQIREQVKAQSLSDDVEIFIRGTAAKRLVEEGGLSPAVQPRFEEVPELGVRGKVGERLAEFGVGVFTGRPIEAVKGAAGIRRDFPETTKESLAELKKQRAVREAKAFVRSVSFGILSPEFVPETPEEKVLGFAGSFIGAEVAVKGIEVAAQPIISGIAKRSESFTRFFGEGVEEITRIEPKYETKSFEVIGITGEKATFKPGVEVVTGEIILKPVKGAGLKATPLSFPVAETGVIFKPGQQVIQIVRKDFAAAELIIGAPTPTLPRKFSLALAGEGYQTRPVTLIGIPKGAGVPTEAIRISPDVLGTPIEFSPNIKIFFGKIPKGLETTISELIPTRPGGKISLPEGPVVTFKALGKGFDISAEATGVLKRAAKLKPELVELFIRPEPIGGGVFKITHKAAPIIGSAQLKPAIAARQIQDITKIQRISRAIPTITLRETVGFTKVVVKQPAISLKGLTTISFVTKPKQIIKVTPSLAVGQIKKFGLDVKTKFKLSQIAATALKQRPAQRTGITTKQGVAGLQLTPFARKQTPLVVQPVKTKPLQPLRIKQPTQVPTRVPIFGIKVPKAFKFPYTKKKKVPTGTDIFKVPKKRIKKRVKPDTSFLAVPSIAALGQVKSLNIPQTKKIRKEFLEVNLKKGAFAIYIPGKKKPKIPAFLKPFQKKKPINRGKRMRIL